MVSESPKKFQERVLEELHTTHLVIGKALARDHVWWLELDSAIELIVRSCAHCQANQASPETAPLYPWPSQPWLRFHVDLLVPFKVVISSW